MQKRIVIISNNSGGLYGFRRELMDSFIKNDCAVTALTPFDQKIDELCTMGIQLIETPLHRRGVSVLEDFSLILLYKKLLKALQPDLVVTYTIKPNIYGGYASRKLHIPYVANITGLGTAFQKESFLKRMVIRLYKYSLKSANTVFFENRENCQVFIDQKIVPEYKTCILNGAGVNLQHFLLSEYPSDETIRFLFIGRVMKEKGVEELFSAMQLLISDGIKCSLSVVGTYEEDYREMIHQYENEGWLTYYGFQNDVRPFISRSHCLVLPSWHEGMANVNLESAASGRPVITSNIHGCMEAVEDGVTGFLCNKRDARDLYLQMKKFSELSYDEKKKMGLAARKHMEKYFDKKVIVSQTLEKIFRDEK